MEEPSEVLERELFELASLFLSDETLDTMLGHVAVGAVRVIPACDSAGVSLMIDGRATTAAVTSPLVMRVDQHQNDTGEGPAWRRSARARHASARRCATSHAGPSFRRARSRRA